MRLSGKSFYIELDFRLIARQFGRKLLFGFERFFDIFRLLPLRVYRILEHLWRGLWALIPGRRRYWWESEIGEDLIMDFCWWFAELVILTVEAMGGGEIYATLMDFLKFNTRPLHKWEIKLAKSVFGESLPYRKIRVDEFALIGPRQKGFAYVSFFTINNWGRMQNSLLLHELTHVWQFQQMGAVYIPKALKAQFSSKGYNYGGVNTLRSYLDRGKGFTAFNLEQQADIVSDYYLIKEGYTPRWGSGKKEDLHIYEQFIQRLRWV